MANRRGRPVVGAIAGLLLGVFLALDLVLLGLLPTNAGLLTVLPVAGLAAGIAAGLTAPFARLRRGRRPAPDRAREDRAPDDADGQAPPGDTVDTETGA